MNTINVSAGKANRGREPRTIRCPVCSDCTNFGEPRCPKCSHLFMGTLAPKMDDVIALREWETGEKRKELFHVPANHPRWAAWMVMRVHIGKGFRFVDEEVIDSICATVVLGTRKVGKSIYFGDTLLSDEAIAEIFERRRNLDEVEDPHEIWIPDTHGMALTTLRYLLESEINDVSDVPPHDMAIIHGTDWSA